MKEEIEMQKLIDLLNEYEKEVKKSEKVWSIDNDWDICRQTYEWVDYNEYTEYMNTNNLISKSFWFIKWLLDKDKINTNYITGYSIYWTDEYFTPYENLLMDLARFEEPLNYLSSLLK